MKGRRKAALLCFRILLVPAVALALAGIGCRKPADSSRDIAIEESIAPQPVRAGVETLSIRLTDAAHKPVAGAHIQVEGDMDHPGMAPAFSNAVETGPGDYRAPLTFTMGGDWVVLFHITLGDGRKIERQWNVKGVESR